MSKWDIARQASQKLSADLVELFFWILFSVPCGALSIPVSSLLSFIRFWSFSFSKQKLMNSIILSYWIKSPHRVGSWVSQSKKYCSSFIWSGSYWISAAGFGTDAFSRIFANFSSCWDLWCSCTCETRYKYSIQKFWSPLDISVSRLSRFLLKSLTTTVSFKSSCILSNNLSVLLESIAA